MTELEAENSRLKAQLAQLQRQQEEERRRHVAEVETERSQGKESTEAVQMRTAELESMKQKVVRLTKQLDEEVSRRDRAQAETRVLEQRMQDVVASAPGQVPAIPVPKSKGRAKDEEEEQGIHVLSKLMRVMDEWMHHRDLQQVLLRKACINDQAFVTLAQALHDCPSLRHVDLSDNLLTMDSCCDLCQLITTSPAMSFLSLAENHFSLRSIGYFMTAVMERQSTKKLAPLDLLDLTGNESLVAAETMHTPEALMKQVKSTLSSGWGEFPSKAPQIIAQVSRALWSFLHDTGHPQVRDTSPDEIAFHVLDKVTLRKMENALMKIMVMAAEKDDARPVTANLALLISLDSRAAPTSPPEAQMTLRPSSKDLSSPKQPALARTQPAEQVRELPQVPSAKTAPIRSAEPRDPFSDVKAMFEPPKEKLKTFNLKQIVTRNGTVLLNMLERLLETTEIDARDVETEQTLLEYACTTGNLGLAKLCYRRGAALAARTSKGDTPFNIVTKAQRYDMMEFLHTYGVKVNSADKDGKTALHCAAHNNDVDSMCRLIEWGADVNIRDRVRRTPIHHAAAAGNMKATMLLLEVGADMNATDSKLFTAAAHANFNDHFPLFDRLISLGGRRHGQLDTLNKSASQTRLGELKVSTGMLKSSSLGRIGKISVAGMPPPILQLALEKQ